MNFSCELLKNYNLRHLEVPNILFNFADEKSTHQANLFTKNETVHRNLMQC